MFGRTGLLRLLLFIATVAVVIAASDVEDTSTDIDVDINDVTSNDDVDLDTYGRPIAAAASTLAPQDTAAAAAAVAADADGGTSLYSASIASALSKRHAARHYSNEVTVDTSPLYRGLPCSLPRISGNMTRADFERFVYNRWVKVLDDRRTRRV
jgi:hypothetical protein